MQNSNPWPHNRLVTGLCAPSAGTGRSSCTFSGIGVSGGCAGPDVERQAIRNTHKPPRCLFAPALACCLRARAAAWIGAGRSAALNAGNPRGSAPAQGGKNIPIEINYDKMIWSGYHGLSEKFIMPHSVQAGPSRSTVPRRKKMPSLWNAVSLWFST